MEAKQPFESQTMTRTTIRSFSKTEDSWIFQFANATGFIIEKYSLPLPFTPQPGNEVNVWTLGTLVCGLYINGMKVFHDSNDEAEARSEIRMKRFLDQVH